MSDCIVLNKRCLHFQYIDTVSHIHHKIFLPKNRKKDHIEFNTSNQNDLKVIKIFAVTVPWCMIPSYEHIHQMIDQPVLHRGLYHLDQDNA